MDMREKAFIIASFHLRADKEKKDAARARRLGKRK